MKYIIIFLLVSSFCICKAQDSTEEKVKAEDQIKQLSSEVKKLKELITTEDKDETIEVGKMILFKPVDVPVYSFTDSNNPISKLDIDEVIVNSKNGYIVSVQVVSGGDSYINQNAPIEISAKRFGRMDWLTNNRTQTKVLLRDFLSYLEYTGFGPSNDNFRLTRENADHSFKKNTGIDNIFDIRLYSDALGIFGAKPNGLVQTDVYFKHYLHRANIRNTGIYLLNNFKFNFNISKFDSKLGYADSSGLKRIDLIQKSWINADISANLANGWLSNRSLSSWFVDVGFGLSATNVAFSKDTSATTSTLTFIEPGIELSVAKNMGVLLSSRIFCHYNYKKSIQENNGAEWFFRPHLNFYWNPAGKDGSRIFGRVIYTSKTKTSSNDYFQVQFGYVLSISELSKSIK